MVSSKMDVKKNGVKMLAPYKDACMASDTLPLPVGFTNKFFLGLFFISTSFLVQRWGEKKKASMPIYVLSLTDIFAVLGFLASAVYLWGFFGIIYIQNHILKTDIECENEKTMKQRCPQRQVPSLCTSSPYLIKDKPTRSATYLPKDKPLKELKVLDNEEIALAVNEGLVASHSLEKELEDCSRAINVRRRAAEIRTGRLVEGLPVEGMDYRSVMGQCCEMVIGFVQVPVGVAGPLKLDGVEFMVPMATTEGCLVASTNRGCKAIHMSGGASSIVLKDGITRAPVVRFGTAAQAAALKQYVENSKNFETISAVFNRTSRFAKLQSIQGSIAGRNLYVRFACSTGDAMGMNMISKGVQNVLEYLQQAFPDMEIVSISGNYCADKKATAVNWIQGRGKSVVCEAIISEEIVAKVLKTSVSALIDLNTLKNLTGSALAGALGGFNAHAANIVSAIFIATGQDPAQNVESSQCMTLMEYASNGIDLHVSVTMPALEVGTVGGGTQLASQAACLNLLGVKGACMDCPGKNAQGLARIISGAVLAGELSLMSALAAGHLVNSHMKYNRSSKNIHSDV